jgi:preprotein translocase subunit SecA
MRLFWWCADGSPHGRLRVDQSHAIESGLLGKNGPNRLRNAWRANNFDVRKHLLEYMMILNRSANRIYNERNRAFEKSDLHEEVITFCVPKLPQRIPKALQNEEGPWKLLALFEEVQPSMSFEQEGIKAPSFALHLIIDEVLQRLGGSADPQKTKEVLLELARESLDLETEHILRSAQAFLDKTELTVEQFRAERLETLENYFDGLEAGDSEEGLPTRRPQEILDEISALVHTPLRLAPDNMKLLPDGAPEVKENLVAQVVNTLKLLAITRTLNTLERRLEESLEMKPGQLVDLEWFEISDGIMRAVENLLAKRNESLLSPQGQIGQNIESLFNKLTQNQNEEYRVADQLMWISSGTRLLIDARTHQRVTRKVNLFNYIFLAARLIQDTPVNEISEMIIAHLEETRERLEIVWGKMEFERFRLAGLPLRQLDEKTKALLIEKLAESGFDAIASLQPDDLEEEHRRLLTVSLGTRIQNDIYRHILVSVISELWVDYLTRVDALRVSIGMEAFAQRDPLVQYKSQAAEMFKTLLSDIRGGVISRMFRYQPRRAGSAPEKTAAAEPEPKAGTELPAQGQSKKKKRKRH